jgi:ADP-ribose pyrophosphatase YjhB (NUDIX family)
LIVLADEPQWLSWAKKLHSIAQAGLTYCDNGYDLDRYRQIQDLSVDILNRYTGIDHGRIRDLFLNDTGYVTPKIDVRAAVFREGDILLIREKVDDMWSLPGGWADIDKSLRQNLIKEAKEEAGVDIEPRRIIAVLDRRNHNEPPLPFGIYKFFVECDYIAGEFKANVETYESGWFTLDNLPPLSIGRNTKDQIEMCFSVRKKKTHETLFD